MVLVIGLSVISAGALVAFNVSETPAEVQRPSGDRITQNLSPSSSATVSARRKKLKPAPHRAKFDKGIAHSKGCAPVRRDGKVTICKFGKKNAPKKVALFGDSHGVQYAPPLIGLRDQKNFRLFTYLRGGCILADVKAVESACNKWRNNAIRRIRNLKPDLIIVSQATGSSYVVKRGGRTLSRKKSERHLRSGMARTLRKLVRVSSHNGGKSKVVLLRDQALAPFRPPDCLKKNANKPGRCAFRTKRPNPPGFDWAGAKRVSKVKIFNPMSYFCGKKWCPAVSGNIVIFRDKYHLTATYARTMVRWLGKRLPL